MGVFDLVSSPGRLVVATHCQGRMVEHSKQTQVHPTRIIDYMDSAVHHFYLAGSYEVKEQYFIYDGHSLMSDVGGYLGLLLGLSIFGILNSFFEKTCIQKAMKRCC